MKNLLAKTALSFCLIVSCLCFGASVQPCEARTENLVAPIVSQTASDKTMLASGGEIEWPGSTTTTFLDTSTMFSQDSSGLDFYNGQLYVVENGDGLLWVLDVAKNGSVSYASGYNKDGKEIKFKSNASSSKAVDTEGVTVDGDGWVYVSTERDTANKSTPKNAIIKINAKASGSTLVGVEEWDLTSSLPKSSDSNEGLEAVEWVSNSELEGKLYDKNKNGLFNSSNYPKQTANGVFFVALEANGHVYGYVLNNDGTYVQIADINAGFGCAMALDYDVSQHVLWIVTDDNGNNMSAQVVFNGTQNPTMTNVKPISTLDKGANYEGFAIVTDDYADNGEKFVYNIEDGTDKKALALGRIRLNYMTSGGSGNGSGNNSGSGSGNSSSGNGNSSSNGSGNSSSNANGNNSSSVNGNQSATQNGANNNAGVGGNNGLHNYSSTWHSNSVEHYYDCSCGQKHEVQAHQVVTINQKAPTKTRYGYTGDKVCSVCNYTIERGQSIDKLPADDNGNVVLTIIFVSCGVALVAGASIAFLILKKKKR